MRHFTKVFFAFFSKKSARQGTAGFSLIELLVVISIIGVLAAVAIPSFQSYRVDAAKASIESSLNSIGKSFAACRVLKKMSECDSLSKIGIDCSDCKQEVVTGNKLCVPIEKEAGGDDHKACMESTGGIPNISGNWGKSCNTLTRSYVCATSGSPLPYSWGSPASATCPPGCASPTLPPTGTGCTGAGTVSCATANPGDRSNPGQNAGTCDGSSNCQ